MSTRACLTAMAMALLPGFALAQTITPLANKPPSDGVIYGYLQTDGTVLFQGGGVTDWYKFAPDAKGSYVNGTWTKVASLPAGYGPYATTGAVLPDGRTLLVGGEYTLSKLGLKLLFTLTTKSAIYDPLTNKWTMVAPPAGWKAIGDSPGYVRADGSFFLGEKVTSTNFVTFDPTTNKWVAATVAGKEDENAEEGWTLLPDGQLLTVDVTDSPNTEIFTQGSGSGGAWASAGDTPVNLKFTWTGSEAQPKKYGPGEYYTPAGEIGPAILRPDGSVFQSGALPLGSNIAHTAVWKSGTWTAGPDFQPGDDAGDEFAVLLPNGNVLVEANTNGIDDDNTITARARRLEQRLQGLLPNATRASTRDAEAAGPQASGCGTGGTQETYHLYEFDGTNFTLEQPEVLTCGNSLSMIVLPTGQTLLGDLGVYTSTGAPSRAWAPTIKAVQKSLQAGSSYVITGTQFNGLSQAANFGDEFPTPTNYPLVRITNNGSGHVFYARTHDHSTMAVATGSAIVSTHFDVPAGIDAGASKLEVVANGIASAPVAVTIQ